MRRAKSRAGVTALRARASQRRALEAATARNQPSKPTETSAAAADEGSNSTASPPAAGQRAASADLRDLSDVGLQAALGRATSALDASEQAAASSPKSSSESSAVSGGRTSGPDDGASIAEASTLLASSQRLNQALLAALRTERERADRLEDALRLAAGQPAAAAAAVVELGAASPNGEVAAPSGGEGATRPHSASALTIAPPPD